MPEDKELNTRGNQRRSMDVAQKFGSLRVGN
jgi:hypothetical protein